MTQLKPHIFLDLDGVVADFETHAHATGKFKPDGKVDYNRLEDEDWWENMPPCKGARAFYDAVRQFGPVTFLTGPVMTPACYSGKAKWLIKFVPEKGKWELNDFIICPSKKKHFLAGRDRILIDDRAENIKAWNDAGGIGVHHTGDFAETLRKLRQAIAIMNKPKGPQRGPF